MALAGSSFSALSRCSSVLYACPRIYSTAVLRASRNASASLVVKRSAHSISFPTEHFDHYKKPRSPEEKENKSYMYFVVGTAGVGYAAVAKNAVVGLLSTWAPAADVLAVSTIEVDLSAIAEGTSVTVKYRGKPLFIRHRPQSEIDAANEVDPSTLPDPQDDASRVKKAQWLVLEGVCTHLGCIPLGGQGDYGGWFCPCHGSHYDTSGRIRKGPAPKNLIVPPYQFIEEERILVGDS
eukprot:Phypoly_transcript_14339.p1 GENE.Phypoly_transcript_14339~~Phypoly_transcript_14339.p1  ORF type:complete len:237 (+),score=38.69 Phypoly_transcript_14339:148-858(+)